MSVFQLYIDGAARGNPGPAGAGAYVTKEQQPVYSGSFFLGHKTNNQAEYWALIFGMLSSKAHLQPGDSLQIISDSELLVRQINGIYAVRHPNLQTLYQLAQRLLTDLNYQMRHVLRVHNQMADRLANVAIDQKIAIPTTMLQALAAYGYQYQ